MFVGPKPNTKGLSNVFKSLRSFSDNVPGGVKMACSSFALAFALWMVVQFGSKSMLAAMEGTAFIKMPMITIESYLDTYSEGSDDRWKRAIRRLPNVDNREMVSTINFAQSVVNRMDRHESNIADADIVVRKGTPMHGQLIDSYPSNQALQHGKDALIAVKASQFLASKHCHRLGIDDETCAMQVSQLPLGPTTLGSKCSTHYRKTVFCSEYTQFRSADGSCNHNTHPSWGQASTAYKRLIPAKYEDGFQKPRGSNIGQELTSPRLISTSLSRSGDVPDMSKTLAVALWGQFVSHDMAHTAVNRMYHSNEPILCCSKDGNTLSPRHIHASCYPISIPRNDPFYGKLYHTCMSYVRSLVAFRPDCNLGPAEQLNQVTHFLDGSTIYGNSKETEQSLRSFWNGRLKVDMQEGREFLPFKSNQVPHCHEGPNRTCYDTGDVRVNSAPHTAIMNTLWVRQHNRLTTKLSAINPHWSDDRLFNEAKKIVIAQIQHITYNEWLPVVLSRRYMKKEGLHLQNGYSYLYKHDVNPSVSNSFATAAIRFVNSLLEGSIGLYGESRNPKLNLLLQNHFNHPQVMQNDEQLDALVRGLATQSSQKMDLDHSESVTRYLFSESGSYGMDGFSLDIQRGRDHGLASYNSYRAYCGLPRAKYFNDLSDTIPTSVIATLKTLYKKVDDIDLLVGGMAEKPIEDALLGPVFRCIIGEQFIRTRKGDKFFL
uniref:Heme peroxidase 2 n=2 Tax=Clastoptera arizonana TaxID=38151 RepID=A0A1B6E785_9HEMI